MSYLQPVFFDNLALLATKRIQSIPHMEKKSMQLLNLKNIPLIQCKPGLFIFMPMLPVRKTQGERHATIINARMKVKKNGCKSWNHDYSIS